MAFGAEKKSSMITWVVIAAIVIIALWYLYTKGYLPF